jgi:hypothetical protein
VASSRSAPLSRASVVLAQAIVNHSASSAAQPYNHLARVGHLGPVRARRTGLLAGPAPTTTPLLPRRGRLSKPVRRRWPGGIGRILAQAPLKLSDPGRRYRIGPTSLALASSNWSITIAWTATVASRSRSGKRSRPPGRCSSTVNLAGSLSTGQRRSIGQSRPRRSPGSAGPCARFVKY